MLSDISKKLNCRDPYIHLIRESYSSNINETKSEKILFQAYPPSNILGGVNCKRILNSNALIGANVAESTLDGSFNYDSGEQGISEETSLLAELPSNSLGEVNYESISRSNAHVANVAEILSHNGYSHDLIEQNHLSSGTVLYDFEVLDDGKLISISCENISVNGSSLQLNDDCSISLDLNPAKDIISEIAIVDTIKEKDANAADPFFKEPNTSSTTINNCEYLHIIKISVWKHIIVLIF